ncbi:DUF4142 domain-containing protein [Flavobacterium sp. Fl-77]|uniref:DUF4142 domain-containing protein n=1 Tax=Flavobacterium flavipigmentatum TaxID=2893884 RepID=A0AAJ2SFF9_9FLAO|nr:MULTISPECIES: DUF4142 domain-containing protein [unclassified Flavobacterium]MDX6181843.1 DUF4142 domain-containing protein [Flavobacterium sp. Fl-33]MDX6185123.1 DUF4142 domain-containing protein [Flavobacterium sp. Fl-77]UFH37231.1 DUF4142 domain-containing protein [Flavobacterium sp. F-70]
MRVKLVSESLFYKIALSVLILFSAESCKENDTLEEETKSEILENNTEEEREAHFFIATANISKKMVSKSQIAQQKTLQHDIKELSKRLEHQQNNIFQEITKMANKKLIIISEINAAGNDDLYKLMNAKEKNFDKLYLNDMTNALSDEITLLQTITKETADISILKLANSILPIQYEFLRETEKLKERIN